MVLVFRTEQDWVGAFSVHTKKTYHAGKAGRIKIWHQRPQSTSIFFNSVKTLAETRYAGQVAKLLKWKKQEMSKPLNIQDSKKT